MITIFNRKELITTYDMNHYANVRDDLKEAGVEFRIRTRRPKFKAVTVNRKINYISRKHATEYTIYVKDEDYNRAMNIIQNKGELE